MMDDPMAGCTKPNLLSLFLDDYGPGMEKDHVIAAGVAVKGELAIETAADEYRALEHRYERFATKDRRWGPDEYSAFCEYVLRQNMMPIAGVVRLTDQIRAASAAEHYFPPGASRRTRPFQSLWFILLTRVMANVVSTCVPFLGPVENFHITVDHGNIRPEQEQCYRDVVADWTGAKSRNLVDETLSGLASRDVAKFREFCLWGKPELRFVERHPLLFVADAMVVLASHAARGVDAASAAIETMNDTYQYRHPGFYRRSVSLDMTESVLSRLQGPASSPE